MKSFLRNMARRIGLTTEPKKKPYKKPKLLVRWVAMLWHVMTTTGKGYKYGSMRNTGKGGDLTTYRRKDKLKYAERGESQMWRRYADRYA